MKTLQFISSCRQFAAPWSWSLHFNGRQRPGDTTQRQIEKDRKEETDRQVGIQAEGEGEREVGRTAAYTRIIMSFSVCEQYACSTTKPLHYKTGFYCVLICILLCVFVRLPP